MPQPQMNPINQSMLAYHTARTKALALYKDNQVKLDKDMAAARESDRFMLAFYYAQRNQNNNMALQLYTAILNDLIEEKERKKNAIAK